jgi:hypothetical protein
MMALQEEGEKYDIAFEEEKGVPPHWIHIRFPSLSVSFYIAEANWPQLIPTLSTVESPLSVHEFQDHKMNAIRYDVKRRLFRIEKAPLPQRAAKPSSAEVSGGIEVGEWMFVPHKGFFPKQIDPIFKQEEIPQEKIAFECD